MKNKNPLAASSNIVVQELQDELLVYNLSNNKATHLNPTAALIWKYCDGKNSVGDLTRIVGNNLNAKIDDSFVLLGLEELNKLELITNYEIQPKGGISRRKAILNMALPVAMLPLVTGILAPSAVRAASVTCVANPAATCVDPVADCNVGNTGADCPTQNCTYSCDANNCCAFTLITVE